MIMKTPFALAAMLFLGIGATSPAAYADGTISACPTVIPASATGTWTVTKNLTAAPNTNCITYYASSIVIDLQGHTITGSPSTRSGGSGITDLDVQSCGDPFVGACQQNVIIANGTITGFDTNIFLLLTKYVTISNVKVLNARQTGIFIEQDNVVVTATKANNNPGFGMEFIGSNITVSDSEANANGFTGIIFTGGREGAASNNSVSNTQANGNRGFGMSIESANSTVYNSQANANGAGVDLIGVGSTITNSQANDNIGVDVSGIIGVGISARVPGILLTGNTANSNQGAGISVVCPSNLYGNSAKGNTGGNIVTSSTGCVFLGDKPAP
jgi:hypothetical protein